VQNNKINIKTGCSDAFFPKSPSKKITVIATASSKATWSFQILLLKLQSALPARRTTVRELNIGLSNMQKQNPDLLQKKDPGI